MRAAASLIYSPAYIPGALVVAHQLRKILPSDTHLVLLIDSTQFSEHETAILGHVWELHDVAPVESKLHAQLALLGRPLLALTFTKIHLWGLPYEQVLYVDADTLPLTENLNETVANLLDLEVPEGAIAAAPDSGFPDIFNSGVFVLRPSPSDYANLYGLATSGESVSFDGADQGLLNQYFNVDPDWVSVSLQGGAVESRWIRIPFLYNTTPSAQYQYEPAYRHYAPFAPSEYPGVGHDTGGPGNPTQAGSETLSSILETVDSYHRAAFVHFSKSPHRVKLLHFIGPRKPWDDAGNPVFEKWWKAWNEFSRGRSISDVLDQKFLAFNVTQLEVPGQTRTISSPSELCDPKYYRNVRLTQKVPADFVETFDDIRTFLNVWDDNTKQSEEHHMNQHTEVIEHVETENTAGQNTEPFVEAVDVPYPTSEEPHEPVPEPETETEAETAPEASSPEFWHSDVPAERVFEGEDFTPDHILLSRGNVKFEDEEEEEDIESETERIYAREVELEDELERIELLESRRLKVPKLFPWEFRDNVAPLRVFE